LPPAKTIKRLKKAKTIKIGISHHFLFSLMSKKISLSIEEFSLNLIIKFFFLGGCELILSSSFERYFRLRKYIWQA
jgi:hypothetical protein